MHQDLPETSLFGYGTSPGAATSPGPTLDATWGTPVQVMWENQIGASAHPLRNDPDIMQATPKSGIPAVVHLHGGEVSSLSDGNPDAWYTKGGEKGPAYTGNVYTYLNSQDPTTLW
jgi:spore coat protein A